MSVRVHRGSLARLRGAANFRIARGRSIAAVWPLVISAAPNRLKVVDASLQEGKRGAHALAPFCHVITRVVRGVLGIPEQPFECRQERARRAQDLGRFVTARALLVAGDRPTRRGRALAVAASIAPVPPMRVIAPLALLIGILGITLTGHARRRRVNRGIVLARRTFQVPGV